MKRSVVIIIQRHHFSEEVLLVSRRGSYDDLGFPGGKIEEGETSRQAIVREVKEEVGIDLALTPGLFIADKPCGEFLVDVYFYKDATLFEKGVDYLNSENCRVKTGTMSDACSIESSFLQFNIEVWNHLVKVGAMPWRSAKDIRIDTLVERLTNGHDDLAFVLQLVSNDRVSVSDLSEDQHKELNKAVIQCEACNVYVKRGTTDYGLCVECWNNEVEQYGEDDDY